MKGLDEVRRNLAKALAEMEGASLEGMIAGGLMILSESQKLTPVVTGNLRGSGYVVWKGGQRGSADIPDEVREEVAQASTGGKATVAVGFAALYAANVHENPRAGKTGGVSPRGVRYTPGRLPSGRMSTRKVFSTVGQWKFLETALKVHSDRFLRMVASRVRRSLKDGRGDTP